MKNGILFILALLCCTVTTLAQSTVKGEIDAFAARSGAIPSIDKATNSIGFLRFPATRPFVMRGNNVQEKSANFLAGNAGIFAIRQNLDVFSVKSVSKDDVGLEHVTMQQTFHGVPVYDGVLKFHYTKEGNLASLNGNFISGIKLSTKPTISADAAAEIALAKTDELVENRSGLPLKVNKNTLYIFQKGLAQGYNGQKHLVYEIEVKNGADVREFLFIDAHNGNLVEQFTGMHAALDRRLYEPVYNSLDPILNLVWKENDPFPGSLNIWQQSEIESAGHIYNLMKNTFGRISFNGADAPMITTHNNPTIFCPNANWDGTSANFCNLIATDDVVAHEWAHAYTEYTSGLVYAFQAGALNESYSDIWGETVDQLNGYLDDDESNLPRNGCASSSKWLLGEKLTDLGGANRDMWDPTCFGDPGKVSDPQYLCTTGDNGGVHSNSGINNHAFALLVDGGTYNGQTITGIGLTKASHIFWRAQRNYLTWLSDFYAQADALEASLNDLLMAGTNLTALSTSPLPAGLSGQFITDADAAELSKVLLAVEMRKEISCPFAPLLAAVPPLCTGATTPGSGLLYLEDFEDGLNGWTTSSSPLDATQFTARNWMAISNAPEGRSGTVAFGTDPNIGDCESTTSESGVIRLESPSISIPAGTAGDILMAFDHYVALDGGFDGGLIKYSIDDGEWKLLPNSAFTANGYRYLLYNAAQGNKNPLAGLPAFTGLDDGSTTGSWGQSQLNLSVPAVGLTAGHSIKLAWEVGTDVCIGYGGWYIDDIRIYSCAVPAVHFVQTGSTVNEVEANIANSCLNYVEKIITVKIDKAPAEAVTVTLNTTGTAVKGETADFSFSPASFTLSAGNLSQNVIVRIYNDAYVEENESVNFTYTLDPGAGDAFAGTSAQQYSLIIADNDVVPAKNTTLLVYSADFNNDLAGWTAINGGNTEETWHFRHRYYGSSLNDSPFIFADSRNPGSSQVFLSEIIESPVINTAGMKGLRLTFEQYFRTYSAGINEFGVVQIFNGSVWLNAVIQSQATGTLGNWGNPNIVTVVIPDVVANANMKIRFIYQGQFDYWWAIDNVRLTRTPSNQIQTAVAAGNQQYLGPNSTAYFYGPTGDLMAKIWNKTTFDYGCTTVEVDRAGQDATPWLSNYNITQKTFKVTPTNNSASGEYEITLYYTATELTNFKNSITSMGKSAGSIGAGNVPSSSFAETRMTAAYDNDFAFSATFNSGFSGFGMSDAPPVGSLPVTLAKFEGRNTVEGNLLNWTTTAEVSNAYFAVEKTVTGKDFKEIGKILGAGNSAVTNHYKFLDTSYPKGMSYYRLKQVDKNGQFAYSRIVSIDAKHSRELKFFPNPVESVLTMELPDTETKSVHVQVINGAGQEVFSKQKVNVNKGNLELDIAKLPTGIYQVILSGENKKYNLSVLKL